MATHNTKMRAFLTREAERLEKHARACERAAREFDAAGTVPYARDNMRLAALARRKADTIRATLDSVA